jgi:hypothetical protein
LKEKVRMCLDSGGSSQQAIDKLVDHILSLWGFHYSILLLCFVLSVCASHRSIVVMFVHGFGRIIKLTTGLCCSSAYTIELRSQRANNYKLKRIY